MLSDSAHDLNQSVFLISARINLDREIEKIKRQVRKHHPDWMITAMAAVKAKAENEIACLINFEPRS